jgi:CelD/BcsL family acetyltransferase involved in cellulose biosynthesis
MAEHEARAGNLRLGLATLDDRPAAAQLWTVSNRVAYIHKLAYDSDLRELSPGTLLSREMFRHAIDIDGVSKIDYGTGDDGHKAAWMDQSAPLDTIRLYKSNAPAGIAGAAREKLSALVRGKRLD